MMSSPGLQITEYDGLSGLEELRGEWDALVASLPSPRVIDSWESHRAFARHLASPGSTAYLAVRAAAGPERGALRAVVPIHARIDSTMLLRVPVLGTPFADEWPHGDVIAPEDGVRSTLLPLVLEHLRATRRGRAHFVVGPLPAASLIWDGLAQIPESRVAVHPQFGADMIDCTRSFDENISALSKNFRGNLRKARNKLAKLEGVEFVAARSPAELAREFEAFLRVEASGWKGSSGTRTALSFHPEKVAYYRELVEEHGARDRCRIDTLYAEGRCIAAQLSLCAKSEYEMLKIGFDEEYARLAPGQLLFERTLQRLCEDPQVSLLNLSSAAAWHADWKAVLTPYRMAHIALNAYGRTLVPLARFRFTTARRIAETIAEKRRARHRA